MTDTDLTAAAAALLADRTRRAEQAAAAIQAFCAEFRVELQPQVTVTGGRIESRVLIVALE